MKGRKPKPVSLRIAEGDVSKVGKRKLQAKLGDEPAASCGLPECPKHLKGRARDAWNFWAEELGIMNLDRRPDAMMLEGICVQYARAVEADIAVERDGITIEESRIDEETGERILLNMRSHPATVISDKCWKLVRSFASEFGLSPVSRTRLAIEKKSDTASELMQALMKPRERKTGTPSVQ